MKKMTKSKELLKLFKLSKFNRMLGFHLVIVPDKDVLDSSLTERAINSTGIRLIKNCSITGNINNENNVKISFFVTREDFSKVKEFYNNLKNSFILTGNSNYFNNCMKYLDAINVLQLIDSLERNKIAITDEITDFLHETENKSTCAAKHIACGVFRYKNITRKIYMKSVGFNHSKNPYFKCNDLFLKRDGQWYYREFTHREFQIDETGSRHKEWSNTHEIHAEIDAMNNYPYNFSKKDFMLVTYSPCINCMNEILKTKIKHIIHFNKFDDYEEVKLLSNYHGVNLYYLNEKEFKESYESCR